MIKKGFTLLEVMISLLITSIIMVSVGITLRQMIKTETTVKAHAKRLQQLQMGLSALSDDATHIIPQQLFDAEHRFITFQGTASTLTLVRTNTDGPVAVMYRLHNGSLQRGMYYYFSKPGKEMIYVSIIDAVTPIEGAAFFQYLGEDNLWYEAWPPPFKKDAPPLPKAIQVAMTIPGWGVITQFFIVRGVVGYVHEK